MKYSVVIPIKNEEHNLPHLVTSIKETMDLTKTSWELLAIDDGSTDGSWNCLNQLTKEVPELRPIKFSKNYGQSSALWAGFQLAHGEAIITLDADMQNDPSDISKLIALYPHSDLVCGIRQKRQDKITKKIISRVSNFIRSHLCDDGVKDTGCSLKIFSTKEILKTPWFYGAHRFIPALFKMRGLKVSQTPVNHYQRIHGKSNYNIFNRSLGPIIDLFGMMWLKNRQIEYSIEESDRLSNNS